MDVPTSLPRQAASAPRKANNSWWGRVFLLTLALVMVLPMAYLAYTSGVSSPPVPSATAAVSAGPLRDEVTISGEVLHPGRYTLLPDERAVSAVLRAGGPTSSAKDTVKVIRSVPGRGNVTLVVSLRKVLAKPMPGNDLPLLPGDAIVIDRKLIKF
ncbi:hypothetical protein [Roseimicrobium sp. ORNL1]|uniref:polysaccharide biosynthesis/export family protein n=1 Tax=Roseimicrobium sp. ORNL1 TaxID=2711231 RepID=UPI0013E1CFC3|nr:hypothetical protein [Roseimicrobium sp. ORNL1]QIF04207.1 hypothetical protein G5S37_22660 [Roseimicrobium sp. ORNL1]